MLSSCCQGNGGSHRLFRQVMWPAALTSPWEAVWCSELSYGWVLWSFSLELLVASKLVPETCGCISLPRPHNASSLQRTPGYGHLKSHGTATEQPPEVSPMLSSFSCSWSYMMHKRTRTWNWKETAEIFQYPKRFGWLEANWCLKVNRIQQFELLGWGHQVTCIFGFLPLRNLDLTACWNWIWINPGTYSKA